MGCKMKDPSEKKLFTRWPREFDRLRLQQAEKVLLLALLGFLGRNNNAYPSLPKLAKAADLSESTTKRTIKSLVDLGVLKTGRSEHGTNSYQIAWDDLGQIDPGNRVKMNRHTRSKWTGKNDDLKTSDQVKLNPETGQIEPTPRSDWTVTQVKLTSESVSLKEIDSGNRINEQDKGNRGYSEHRISNGEKTHDPFAQSQATEQPKIEPELDDWGYPIEPTSPEPQPTAIALKTPVTGQGLTITPPNESESGKLEKIQPRALKRPKPTEEQLAASRAVWNEYSAQFERRYGTPPDRPSAKENSQVKQLISAVGVEWALHLVAYYLHTDHAFYVRACHPFGMIVSDRHKLSTELKSGKRVFYTDSIEAEKKQRSQQHVQTDWDEIEDPFETEEETRARHARLEAKKNVRRTNLLR